MQVRPGIFCATGSDTPIGAMPAAFQEEVDDIEYDEDFEEADDEDLEL